tara:strand:+ start:455 stop:574 length:120 start_codon:yes stop_codon:yes gene_type:complete
LPETKKVSLDGDAVPEQALRLPEIDETVISGFLSVIKKV